MKIICGFILGVIISLIAWNHQPMFFQFVAEEYKEIEEKTITSVEAAQEDIATPVVSDPPTFSPAPPIQTENNFNVALLKQPEAPLKQATAIEIATQAVLDEQLFTQKKYKFWKPFSLQSKAEKFATHVEQKSGVTCLTEKIKPGKYFVYFKYSDEFEKEQNITLLSKAGILL